MAVRKRKTSKRRGCAKAVKTTAAKRRKTSVGRKKSQKRRSFWDILWND